MKTVSQANIPATKGNGTASPVKAAHSPLPWFVNEFSGTEVGFDRDQASDEIVTAADLAGTVFNLDGGQEEAKANANLIVRAVNNHDAMESALRGFTFLENNIANYGSEDWLLFFKAAMEDANKAIAAATLA